MNLNINEIANREVITEPEKNTNLVENICEQVKFLDRYLSTILMRFGANLDY